MKRVPRAKSEEQKRKIHNLFLDHQNVFAKDEFDIGRTNLVEHTIDTGDSRPVKQPPRRMPLAFAGEDRKAIEKFTKQGGIRPSTSQWASPLVMVRKKTGDVHPCVDFRRLNSLTLNSNALPKPQNRRLHQCTSWINSVFSNGFLVSILPGTNGRKGYT